MESSNRDEVRGAVVFAMDSLTETVAGVPGGVEVDPCEQQRD
jgi:hypothetical protein